MFVYEVRENAGYDGILDRVLIKDDENALEKVKETLIGMLEFSHHPLASITISDVKNMSKLGEYHNFEVGYYMSFEVEKVEVI